MSEPTFADALRVLTARGDALHEAFLVARAAWIAERDRPYDPDRWEQRDRTRRALIRALAEQREARECLAVVMRLRVDALDTATLAQRAERYARDDMQESGS